MSGGVREQHDRDSLLRDSYVCGGIRAQHNCDSLIRDSYVCGGTT